MFNTQIKKDIEKIKEAICLEENNYKDWRGENVSCYIYNQRKYIMDLSQRLTDLEKFLNIEYKAKSEVPAHYEKKTK